MAFHMLSATPRIARALAALVLGAGLLAFPVAGPPPAAGVGPLPACRLDDLLTFPRDYENGPTTFVDHIFSLGKDYVPPDLVPASRAGVAGGGSVRRIALRDLRELAQAAAANGTPLSNISSYRSYRSQRQLFRTYVNSYGFDEAITFSARPGHSEHQLGLTFDFTAPGDAGLTSNWEETPTGGWMAANAWQYGWVMSFPKGKMDVTCFSYEPWHYRYVGRDVARAIHDSGLTTREYLWEHYALVDPTTGEPLPTGSPAPSSPTSPDPSADPVPTSVATGTPGLPTAPPMSPVPTPPTAGAGTWFGLEPPVVIVGGLLVLALAWLAASGGRRRRSGRR
jgi:D-alanyl-D-alanine carboxypeptidase